MINISPVWILSELSEIENENFSDLLNRQFKAFTENELGLEVSDHFPAHKWWGMDKISEISYMNNLPISMSQAYPNDANQVFVSNRMTVILMAKLSDFKNLDDKITKIKERLNGLRGYTILYYAIIIDDYRTKDSKSAIESLKPLFTQSLFNAIVLQNHCNKNAVNSNGYLHLDSVSEKTELNERLSLASQTVFNLALGGDKLYGNVINNKNIFVSGGFSLVFENDVAKSKMAEKHLSLRMLDEFLNNEKDSCWLNDKILPQSFEGNLSRIKAADYYDQAILLFEYEFKDVNKFFKHAVSPWALLSASLIPKYFIHELRNLPQKLLNSAYLLDLRFLEQFRTHLQKAIYSEQGIKNSSLVTLHSLALSVWYDCNVEGTTPVGLKQFIHNLSLVKEKIIAEKELLLDKTEFAKISYEREPLKIPKIISKEYRKIRDEYTYGTSDKEISDAEKLKDGEERGLIKKLVKAMQLHPLPLSLIVRSGLLGLVLSVVSLSLIKLFPNFFFNTSYFEQGTGMYIWLVSSFALPIFLAFLQYYFGTIFKIRQLKKKILAWLFYKVQLKLIKETREKITSVLDDLLKECTSMETNLKTFLSADPKSDIVEYKYRTEDINELIPRKEYSYPINFFQQSVLEPIDQDSELRFTTNFDESAYYISTPNKSRLAVNGLSTYDLYNVFCMNFINESLYKRFFNDVILSSKLNMKEFIYLIHDNNEKLVQSDIESIDDFDYTDKAADVIKTRSHPSFYDYASQGITKFGYSVISDENSVPQKLDFMKPTTDGRVTNIIVTGDDLHPVKIEGFRQYCEYYRLTSEKDLITD
ncbi:MAG: hypothetical protein PHE33_01505 [Bacteroidales bacterium]|nr:hypothetical protein [Bacteroidales bacterium]